MQASNSLPDVPLLSRSIIAASQGKLPHHNSTLCVWQAIASLHNLPPHSCFNIAASQGVLPITTVRLVYVKSVTCMLPA